MFVSTTSNFMSPSIHYLFEGRGSKWFWKILVGLRLGGLFRDLFNFHFNFDFNFFGNFLAIFVAIMVPSASSRMLTPAPGCVAWFRAIDSIFISCLFWRLSPFTFTGFLMISISSLILVRCSFSTLPFKFPAKREWVENGRGQTQMRIMIIII